MLPVSNLLQTLHLRFDGGDLLFEPGDLPLCDCDRLPVRAVQLSQVASNTLLQLRHALLELGVGEVLVAVVDRLELAAIDRNDRLGEQIELAAQHDEFATDVADRLAIVLAEVGNRLEVRHQPTGQPDQLDVAMCFPLQATARLNPIEVTVDVDLQQHRRMIGGPSDRFRAHALETQPIQIELLDEDLNDLDRISPQRCSRPGSPETACSGTGSRLRRIASWRARVVMTMLF